MYKSQSIIWVILSREKISTWKRSSVETTMTCKDKKSFFFCSGCWVACYCPHKLQVEIYLGEFSSSPQVQHQTSSNILDCKATTVRLLLKVKIYCSNLMPKASFLIIHSLYIVLKQKPYDKINLSLHLDSLTRKQIKCESGHRREGGMGGG